MEQPVSLKGPVGMVNLKNKAFPQKDKRERI